MAQLFNLYLRIVKALDDIDAPYMIVGAFAGAVFGVVRSTADIDILVDLKEEHFDSLAANFPLPRYYADPEMMRNSTQMGIMFNIIDSTEGVKADLVPLSREPEYLLAFDRRVREKYIDENGNEFEAWFAQPTDIIIGKLRAWNEGRSDKHPKDIYAILYFCLRGYSSYDINLDEVTIESARLGQETLEMWKKTLARTRQEIEKGNEPRKW